MGFLSGFWRVFVGVSTGIDMDCMQIVRAGKKKYLF